MTACPKCGFDADATVLSSWIMLVERDPKSMNDRVVNTGIYHRRYKTDRTAWQWSIRAARLAFKVPKAKGRRRITLTRLYNGRQREWDRDNLIGGMKVIVDALVLEGLLVGDDPASAEIHYAQHPGLRGLKIQIEELA